MGRYSGKQKEVPAGVDVTHYTCQFPSSEINRRVTCGRIRNLTKPEEETCRSCGCFYFSKRKPQERGPYQSVHSRRETY